MVSFYRFWTDSVQFLFQGYHISNLPAWTFVLFICLFSINTEEKRAFIRVNTQITVTEGAIKLRTSGLFSVSHKSRVSLKNTHKHKQTELYAHTEGPNQGSVFPLSHCILVSNTSNTNAHAVRSDYTEL